MKTTPKTARAYTPGPWIHRGYKHSTPRVLGYIIENPRDETVIATCETKNVHSLTHEKAQETAEANARLIAAAPDMLALLTTLVLDYERDAKTTEYFRTAVSARALLATINGEG